MKIFFTSRTATIAITALLAWPYIVKAQQPSGEQSLRWSRESITNEFRLGLTYHKSISNVKPSLSYELHIDNTLLVGAFCQFTTGNFSYQYDNYQNNIMTQEAGLIVGFHEKNYKLIYFGGQVKMAYTRLRASSQQELKLFRSARLTATDDGTLLNPELNANLNVSRAIALQFTLGYSALLLRKESVVPERSLDTWTFGLSSAFKFNHN